MAHTNEIDLIIKYADEKGGGADGQLIIDDIELERSRENRHRHGIGNEQTQVIEKGNKTATLSTTAYMNSAAARALERIEAGEAEAQAVYVRDPGNWKDKADGMVFNTLTTSASDDGDTTVSIDADLLGLKFDYVGG